MVDNPPSNLPAESRDEDFEVEQEEEQGRAKVAKERVRVLHEPKGKEGRKATGVVYWMSRDQRANDNWALLYAQQLAVKSGVPLAVAFCLLPSFKGASIRHFGFMVRGLTEVEKNLNSRGIPMLLLKGLPQDELPKALKTYGASHLVCDFSPLRIGRKWREEVAEATNAFVYEVDAHNLVPLWEVSPKQEYAARTIRPKIHKQVPKYLHEFPALRDHSKRNGGNKWSPAIPEVNWDSVWSYVREHVDDSVPELDWLKPGEKEGRRMLDLFLTKKLKDYNSKRNTPVEDGQSNLSAYLHYGQLSAQRIILEAMKHKAKAKESYEAYFEELIVRRELADNFCYYNQHYDQFEGFPDWARKSLEEHAADKRSSLYTYEELERGKTHDELWNAAQMEMVHLGKMHGFMRMYWAKKILEWTESPQQAMQFAVKLNDHYEIDGRDPNGYVGCAWAIGGVHDQGWKERLVFGKVRYMNYAGCKRKFDVDAYVRKMAKFMSEPTGTKKTEASAVSRKRKDKEGKKEKEKEEETNEDEAEEDEDEEEEGEEEEKQPAKKARRTAKRTVAQSAGSRAAARILKTKKSSSRGK